MEICKEIKKIVEYQNMSLSITERRNESSLKQITESIQNDFNNGNYNFSKFTDIAVKQMGKVRHIKTYAPFSCEETLCIYLKRILDRKFSIKYPNRNEYIHSLFDMTNALRTMNDYSIFRFDFEDFFNSVSSEYVFEKYILNSSLEREQAALFQKFVKETKYTYAGLNTSNIICEIIAKHFDELLLRRFKKYGLIFYRRYIDDGILIFNTRIDNSLCTNIVNGVINEIFFDESSKMVKKCKTRLNASKTQYISGCDLAAKNMDDEFDFLGYKFVLKPGFTSRGLLKTDFRYGITQKKIDKYSKKITDMVKEYKCTKNIELLRHQIKAFTSRTVYRLPKYKSWIWKIKGFISNYQELRDRMDFLTVDTKDFLENAIENAFRTEGLPLPYFLLTKKEESIYSLYNNMRNYRTLLFVEEIGITKAGLEKLCKQVGVLATNKQYDGLVREYLIKVKVGH